MRLAAALATVIGSGCTASHEARPGRWRSLPGSGAPSSRALMASAWTGQFWVLWGGSGPCTTAGLCGDGALLDPAAGAWQALPPSLSPRDLTDGAAGGSTFVVFGGRGCPGVRSACGDGAALDLAARRWTPLPSASAPSPRAWHRTTWTDGSFVVWGGADPGTGRVLGDGAMLAPGSSTWRTLPTTGAPSPRRYHAAVWTGSELLVWGGSGGTFPDVALADGAAYDPRLDRWRAISAAGAPSARWAHTAVWTGSELLVFGGLGCGQDASGPRLCGVGGRYRADGDRWAPMRADGAPSPRSGHSAVWTGTEMWIWGGAAEQCADGSSGPCADGAAYDPARDRWRPLLASERPTARAGHVATWTGTEMLVWGGELRCEGGSGACAAGEAYHP